jgi:hypothetical protein
MAEITPIRKRRSIVTGVLLILLGVWGGLAPFVGPYFHYAYTPDTAWHFTQPRLWLEVLPGGAAVLGGLVVLISTRRLLAAAGGILAMLGGGWFVVGTVVNTVWTRLGTPGVPVGVSAKRIAAEKLGMFSGLGAVIVFVAALAIGIAAAAAYQTRLGAQAGSDDDADDETDAKTEAETMAAGRFWGEDR